MKKNVSLLFLLLVLSFWGCKPPNDCPPNCTPPPILNLTFVDGSTYVQFIDVNDPGAIITTSNVTFIGPNASRIRAVNGSSQFRVENNFIALGLSKVSLPASGTEYPVHISIFHPDYLPTSEVIILEKGATHHYVVHMIRKNNPPPGVARTQSSFAQANGAVIAVGNTPSVPEQITLTVEPGTQFFDENGFPLTGQVDADIFFISSSTPPALFPNGLTPDLLLDSIGNYLGPKTMYSAGAVDGQLIINGQIASNFDPPIAIYMEINPNTLTPMGTIQVGDELPWWSYDSGNQTWVLEGLPKVVSGAGGLVVYDSISHFSFWNMDFIGDRCPTPIDFPLSPQCFSGTFYTEIQDVQNGNQVLGQRIINYNCNPPVLTIYNLPDRLVRLVIYSGSSYVSPGNVISVSQPFQCTSTPVDMGPPPNSEICLDVTVMCDSTTCPGYAGNVYRIQHGSAFVRTSSNQSWVSIADYTARDSCTNMIQPTMSYDIMFVIGGVQYSVFSNYTFTPDANGFEQMNIEVDCSLMGHGGNSNCQ